MWEVTLHSHTKLNMFCTGTFLKTEDCGGVLYLGKCGIRVKSSHAQTSMAVCHSHLITESKYQLAHKPYL